MKMDEESKNKTKGAEQTESSTLCEPPKGGAKAKIQGPKKRPGLTENKILAYREWIQLWKKMNAERSS